MFQSLNKYSIIYADPPWCYRDTQKKAGTHYFGASVRYNTMALKELCKLPVQDITDKNCCLFLWAVSPLLPEAFQLIQSWGFKYKTVAFVWSKQTKTGKDIANLGRWTMGNIEICLLATKGKCKRIKNNIRQLIKAERTKHSRKPDIVRLKIVELIGDLPRIELFARENTEGWDAWGNEI